MILIFMHRYLHFLIYNFITFYDIKFKFENLIAYKYFIDINPLSSSIDNTTFFLNLWAHYKMVL